MPEVCGLRHPITLSRCVLPPGAAHETRWGETWSTNPDDDPDAVVKYDGAGQPVKQSQLPRSLRRQR